MQLKNPKIYLCLAKFKFRSVLPYKKRVFFVTKHVKMNKQANNKQKKKKNPALCANDFWIGEPTCTLFNCGDVDGLF